MEHFRCNRDSSKIHATFSNPTLPMLIKPIPISSRDTPRTFFVNAGISISSPSPSTNMTPLENNKTLRFASKYLDRIFAKEIPLHSKTSVPNRSNPLQAMSVHQLSSLHLLFQYLKLQKDELNVWTSRPAYRYVQLGDY